ncbi:MAG: molybdopterin-guanine dinucleotide biosynthesis protein B [Alphaproteobacteria bacterium]|nr:molybdopterin-guanine dinucleotide biosynthesis protein B [Alphaproteobacteria bacterium]
MKRIGLAGWQGSGKTTLAVKLLDALIGRGFAVSTIKHAHHAFDIDQPGKDSYQHRMAGAKEVMVTSANRWALMHEHRGEPEASLDWLLARMQPADLVLVEGFKREVHAKIEVYRAPVGKPLMATADPHIVAIASDVALAGLAIPRFDIDDVAAIADFIVLYLDLRAAAAPKALVG